MQSGYVQRAMDKAPLQGSKLPWKLYQNYALDLATLRFGKVNDETLVFSNPISNRPSIEKEAPSIEKETIGAKKEKNKESDLA